MSARCSTSSVTEAHHAPPCSPEPERPCKRACERTHRVERWLRFASQIKGYGHACHCNDLRPRCSSRPGGCCRRAEQSGSLTAARAAARRRRGQGDSTTGQVKSGREAPVGHRQPRARDSAGGTQRRRADKISRGRGHRQETAHLPRLLSFARVVLAGYGRGRLPIAPRRPRARSHAQWPAWRLASM